MEAALAVVCEPACNGGGWDSAGNNCGPARCGAFTCGTVITFRPPRPLHDEPLKPPQRGENDWYVMPCSRQYLTAASNTQGCQAGKERLALGKQWYMQEKGLMPHWRHRGM